MLEFQAPGRRLSVHQVLHLHDVDVEGTFKGWPFDRQLSRRAADSDLHSLRS